MTENTATTYPFPDVEDDELKHRFNIEPREYTTDQKDAAAMAWSELCRNPLEPAMFVKLIAVCEGNLAEATALWDTLQHHRLRGLKKYNTASANDYIKKFTTAFFSRSGCHAAFSELSESGLIVLWPVARGHSHKFRVDWIELSERLAEVSDKLPGLVSFPAVEVTL